MKVEINQSNKIEQTNKNTVLGLTDEKTFTILITSKNKRKLQEEFRRQGKPKLFVYRTLIPEMSFEKIGRKSKVHRVCYLTVKGKYKIDKVIGFGEIKRLALR